MKYISKLYILVLILIFYSISFAYTFAAEVLLTPSVHTPVGIAEQFYVDVQLDAQGLQLNGIEGNVVFSPSQVSFVRAEIGSSLIELWITKPELKNSNTISFAGIIPTGFDGVIDPFNPKHKLPGQIVRLVFEGQKAGNPNISLTNVAVTRNDGFGTQIEPSLTQSVLTVENNPRPYEYINTQKTAPIIDAHIVRDPNLFDNKYVLVFNATDRGTGIKDVRLREGEHEWKSVESPYVLLDQSRHSVLMLQATNESDESVVVTINPLPYRWTTLYTVCVGILILVIFFVLYYFYVRKKNNHSN